MNLFNINIKPVEYILYQKINEDTEYIPRFQLKNNNGVEGIEINKPIKPTQELIEKAIKYGMIFLVTYKGKKDNAPKGHERVIYPLVIGKSSVGNILIRGYHLKGWSISNNRHVEKIWRMFRLDRVLSITFTGSFYRLPPSGYNMNDRGMKGGIIAKADFNEIRRNQQSLVKSEEIQNKEKIVLDDQKNAFVSVKVKSTGTKLNMDEPLECPYLNNVKDIANVRISFLKSVYGNTYFVILGAMGRPGNTAKLIDEKGKNLGVFKVLTSISGDDLRKIKGVKGNKMFDVYIFDKKI